MSHAHGGLCVCLLWCVDVCLSDVLGKISPGKDTSEWIGTVYYGDSAKVRNRGKKTIPSLCQIGNEHKTLSAEH